MIKLKNLNKVLIIILILLTWSCNSKRKFHPQCEQNPKYYEEFKLPDKLMGYNNYEQAVECALKNDKPLAIYFTGFACVNCRKFEDNFLNTKGASKILNENFVFVALHVDDRTKLPEEDQFYQKRQNGKKRKIVSIGNLNSSLWSKYKHGSQPALFITYQNDSTIYLTGYDPNKEDLLNKLKSAIEN